LVVTSEVRLGEAEAQRSLHLVRDLKRGTATQLGLSKTLIALTPAPTGKVDLAVEFLLGQHNRLADLKKIISEDGLASVLSLAPGAGDIAAKTTKLVAKMLETFLDTEERKPLLRFNGDLLLSSGELSDAFIVVLGSSYDRYPLPRPLPSPDRVKVSENELLLDGQSVTQYSFIAFDLAVVERRGEAMGRGEPWDRKLAEVDIVLASLSPFAAVEARHSAWRTCERLIRDAHALLNASPLYLRKEVTEIVNRAYLDARVRALGETTTALGAPPSLDDEERAFLEVRSPEELKARVEGYAKKMEQSERKLRELGLLA
jgi:hypothetical protein